MRPRRCAVWAAACLLAGCAVGPDFKKPAAPDTTRYTTEAPPPVPAASGVRAQRLIQGRDIPDDWWRLFRSAPLDALMRQALGENPDLQAAQAALRAAQESAAAQRSSLFPSTTAQYNATRERVADPVASPLASGAEIYTLHTAQLSIAYVADVFGGGRRQLESLQAQADVQRFQLEAAHLTLAGNLVSAVIQRAATRAQIDATQALIELAARQLALLRRQQALGHIGAADVAAQEAAEAQLEATLPPLAKQLAQQGHQIAALGGKTPAEARVPDIALEALTLPDELPLSLPSQLVEQRPDVRAAAAQLQAASAQIGVALANRLPSFNLTAGLGSSALEFSKLFSAGTGFWGLGADIAQPVLDAGALRHRERAAEAAFEQAAAQYRGTVVVAFQNVADTLDAIQADSGALGAALAAERAAERSLDIARRQHAAGSVGALAVLGAEQAWRQAMLARIQAQASRLGDTALLFQALGGGWWNRAQAAAQASS